MVEEALQSEQQYHGTLPGQMCLVSCCRTRPGRCSCERASGWWQTGAGTELHLHLPAAAALQRDAQLVRLGCISDAGVSAGHDWSHLLSAAALLDGTPVCLM